MLSQLTPRSSLRFSLTSCLTEDTADSASVVTPLDLSPCLQPTTQFPIITLAEQETPYLTQFHIPDVAAVVTRTRHRQQGPFSPIPRSIQIIQPQERPSPLLPTTPFYSSLNNNSQQQGEQQIKQKESSRLIWPRIKRILSSSSLSSSNQSLDSHTRKKPSSSSRGMMTHLSSLVHTSMRLANSISTKDQDRTTSTSNSPPRKQRKDLSSSRRWFGKNKARVAPHHHPVS
ncbi:uncharacterized protein BX664DRAFT_319966 [Halteromyces radiatus]|uniref:uncharacterized protein n=1 Tax=Halteromyces radiatus TaxID=101107 RepID=UPI00221FEFA7|nr:uncharacterized protein BX664DRAFT_319966 [Halteromyces radiatus]KAI8098940.1 hypothetical protein BX664DRAFT_319966 [Halteromyces radiatus]